MKTGQRVRIKYNGKIYIGEIINIRKACNCLVFILDCLPQVWLSEEDIVY